MATLGNSMDRGAWRAAVHGVAKSHTQLNDGAQHTQEILALGETSFIQYTINYPVSSLLRDIFLNKIFL